jgi:hypothetical protein
MREFSKVAGAIHTGLLVEAVHTERAVADLQLEGMVSVKKLLNALLNALVAITEVRHVCVLEQFAHFWGQTLCANQSGSRGKVEVR